MHAILLGECFEKCKSVFYLINWLSAEISNYCNELYIHFKLVGFTQKTILGIPKIHLSIAEEDLFHR